MANLTDIYKKASLVMKPAAMKEGKLYSQQPHSGAGDFTFSRANGVQTRINEHGLIETVADNTPRLSYDLVTKEDSRTNYATNSESIHNYSNVGGSSPNPTLTASYTEAPDGSPTATRLQATVTGSSYSLIQFPSTADGDGTYYISVYAKSNTEDNQTISFYGNGTTTTAHTVTPEWTRITVEATRGAGITKYAFLGTWPNNHGTDSSIDISLWGAQIEVNVEQASDYIPTGDEPVTIPAVVVASECPTLLLEPTKTNQTTYSEDLSNTSYWNNVIGASVLTNEGVAPDGTNTANKVKADGGSNYKIIRKGAFSIPSGTTMSMFVKKGNHDYIIFKAQGDYGFNLSTLEWQSNYANVGYELYPNGWVRLYATTTSSSTSYFGIYLANSSFGQFWSSTGDEFVYAWGAQYETGEYATSYIPTEGSAEVRNVDTANVANLSGMPTDYPLTVFWEGEVELIDSNQTIFSIHKDGSAVDYLKVSWANTGYIQVERRRTTQDIDSITYSIAVGDNKKVAISFTSATTYKIYIDGALLRDETSGTNLSWDFDSVVIGTTRVTSDTGFRNSCKDFALFNEALSDSELITLTT